MVQVLSLAHRGTGKGKHEGRVRSLEKQIFSRDTHSVFPAPPQDMQCLGWLGNGVGEGQTISRDL